MSSIEEHSPVGPTRPRPRPTYRWTAVDEFRRHLDLTDWSALTPSRRDILEAFLRLSRRHGFSAVSMRTLAKEIALSAPSIYVHFPRGREEIVAQSLRWHFHRAGSAVLQALEHAVTADALWEVMVALHFTRRVQLPDCDLWYQLIAMNRMARILPDSLGEHVEHWLGLYRAIFVAAARDMGFPDSAHRVDVVMTILEGSNRWFPSSEEDITVATGAAHTVALSRQILRLPLQRGGEQSPAPPTPPADL